MKNTIGQLQKLLGTALLLTGWLLPIVTNAQLTVGDSVPDIAFQQMLNHGTPHGRLSDFKGKAVIINLWYKECGSSIEAMLSLDSIQKEFAGDLQVLPVTWQSRQEIERFWKEYPLTRHLRLVQAVGDTVVRKMFPAATFPHQIWIHPDGKVAAITDTRSMVRPNIERLVNGLPLDLEIKQDELDGSVAFSVDPMITYYYEKNLDKMLFYSYFSRYRPEFTGGTSGRFDRASGMMRMSFRNTGFMALYHHAYAGDIQTAMHPPTRIIREDSNPIATGPDRNNMDNVFCYDLMYRDTSRGRFGRHMVPDLDRFFGLRSHEREVEMECYIIRPTGANERYREPLEPDKGSYITNERLEKGKEVAMNASFLPLRERQLMLHVEKPLLWEFGGEMRKVSNLFKRKNLVSMKVTWDLDDLDAMNRELAAYGLEIVLERRPRKVIVLQDR